MANFAWNNRDTSIERNGLLASVIIEQNAASWGSAHVPMPRSVSEPFVIGSGMGFAQAPVILGPLLLPSALSETVVVTADGLYAVSGFEVVGTPQPRLYSGFHVSSQEQRGASSLVVDHYSPSESTFLGARMSVIRDIGRLKDGWDGPGTRAPSRNVKNDVARVANCFPMNSAEPSVEIDPDDGTVVLRWAKSLGTFSLTFVGARSVTGFLLDGDNKPAWRVGVSDFKALYSRLHDERVIRVMAK